MGSLIICMAGLNTRFHDVGFDVPKYLLPWRDTCIVAAIVDEFQKDYKFDDVLLLANKRDWFVKRLTITTPLKLLFLGTKLQWKEQ